MSNGTMGDPAPLVALCRVLAPSDARLEGEVQQTLDAGDADDAWFTLLDGLQARHRLVVLDWHAPTAEMIDRLDNLLPVAASDEDRWGWVDAAAWDHCPGHVFLDAVGERLGQQGLVLTYFATGEDNYPVTVIEAHTFPLVAALAARAGWGVEACQQDRASPG